MTKYSNLPSEDKIKEAARTVFYKKGFAATRTRDIAEEANINLGLINYYFRSKSKLFEIIMIETLSSFISNIRIVLNNDETSLDQKVQEVARRYIDLILKEPEIPTFLVTEIRNNARELLDKLPVVQTINGSIYFKQYQNALDRGEVTEPNPLHFLMNVIGLIIFPFIAKPMLMEIGNLKTSDFRQMMEERKELIPIWIEAMMKAK